MPSHDEYATWVAKQIRGEGLDKTPATWIREHRDAWRNVFAGIVEASGVLELPALVISRWEFLGSLYRGNIGQGKNDRDTNCLDAVVFAKRFLEPVNAQYRQVHNLTGRADQQDHQSDMFMMVRNKPLHGANPSAIEKANGAAVVTWMIGAGPTGNTHLTLDDRGSLHVNGTRLYLELLDAMTLFADYLDLNTERGGNPNIVGAHLPRERWLRAAWARFRPNGMHDRASWMVRGEQHGIPV